MLTRIIRRESSNFVVVECIPPDVWWTLKRHCQLPGSKRFLRAASCAISFTFRYFFKTSINLLWQEKRTSLKHIVGSRTTSHHTSFTESSVTLSSTAHPESIDMDALGVQEDPLYSNLFEATDTEEDALPSSSPTIANESIPAGLLPRLDIPAESRCSCGQHKLNMQCSERLCSTCCSKRLRYCNVASHRRNKPEGWIASRRTSSVPTAKADKPKPPLLVLNVCSDIQRAMTLGKDLYIAYTNWDPNEKRPRKVRPLQWLQYNSCFKALCFNENPPKEKHFNVCKIARISEDSWGDQAAASKGNLFLPSFIILLLTIILFRNSNSTTIYDCGRMAQFIQYGSLLQFVPTKWIRPARDIVQH